MWGLGGGLGEGRERPDELSGGFLFCCYCFRMLTTPPSPPHTHAHFFLDDKKVIHVRGRDPSLSSTDSETVKKPILINTDLAKEARPPHGKSK